MTPRSLPQSQGGRRTPQQLADAPPPRSYIASRLRDPVTGLTINEERFVYAFISQNMQNSKQAATKVGMSEASAVELLSRPSVQEFLKAEHARITARFILSAQQVLEEVSAIATSNVADMFETIEQEVDENGERYTLFALSLKNFRQLPRAVTAAIRSIEVTPDRLVKSSANGRGGQVRLVPGQVKLRLWDKLTATQMLMEHHRLIAANTPIQNPANVDKRRIEVKTFIINNLNLTAAGKPTAPAKLIEATATVEPDPEPEAEQPAPLADEAAAAALALADLADIKAQLTDEADADADL